MARSGSRSDGKEDAGMERTAEDAAKILWKSIEEARMYMEDPMMTLEEKRRWAKTLADMIGVYNKLLANLGGKQLDDEDLGTLLTRVPRKLHLIVMRRVRMWRRRSS